MGKIRSNGSKPHHFNVCDATLESEKFVALPPTAKLMFFYLIKCRHMQDKDGWFWRTDEQLAKEMNLSEKSRESFRIARKALKEAGVIDYKRLPADPCDTIS